MCYILAGDKKTAETSLTGAAAQQGQSTLDDGVSESRWVNDDERNCDFWFVRAIRESEEIALSSWLLFDLLGIKKYTSKCIE